MTGLSASRNLGGAFALLLAAAPQTTPVPEAGIVLPPALAPYRDWRTAAAQPFPVPYELWIQCVHPSREQEAKAAREHGPHNRLEIQVYTDPIASRVFYAADPGVFPEGAIIVKEKRTSASSSPVAVAAMIKGPRGRRPASEDWEFYYATTQGPVEATELCQDCHRTAPTDFVFRSYPAKAAH